MIGIYDIERIYAHNSTLTISRSNNNRDTRCGFVTSDDVQEWDEIFIQNDYDVNLFAGILDSPTIDFTDNITVYKVDSSGYQKLFDRDRVQDVWENELAGDIVRDIVTTFCGGFTTAGIEDGVTISKVLFNYVLPSEAIQRIADAIGYRWHIDADKVVYFVANDAENAPEAITNTGDFWQGLQLNIDISNLVNVVIVRGGTYLSEPVTYSEIADGVKTQFVLPEKPHDVHVFINSVEKTVGIKFGADTPTTDFQVNFNEKYIENGTFATLADGDLLEVVYTYDVPIRVRRKNDVSIAAMQLLFPETNGEFTKVIQDKAIDTRELAYAIAQQSLDKYGSRLITGSFSTTDDIFAAGQIIPITKGSFTGSAVIQKINSRQLAGGLWRHNVSFATVLFGFEEFMRDLYAARKVELIDGETLETSHDFAEVAGASEIVIAGTDVNQQIDTAGAADDTFTDLNVAIDYVLSPYFPSSFVDPKRVFILDASPLA